MFNSKLREDTLSDLDNKIKEQRDFIMLIQEKASNLFSIRDESSRFITTKIKNYIRKLNNAPQEYEQDLSSYRDNYRDFLSILDDVLLEHSVSDNNTADNNIDEDLKTTTIKSVAIGTATATGVATILPSAAMAIASTFGTASTGTAIATLYGAASTTSSLAWLGGGALAAGGGGMASGSAFLALAGPAGLVVGSASATAIVSNKNISIAEKAKEDIDNINLTFYSLQSSSDSVDELIKTTELRIEKIKILFSQLKSDTPNDYLSFTNDQKRSLRRLITQINIFSKLLKEKA